MCTTIQWDIRIYDCFCLNQKKNQWIALLPLKFLFFYLTINIVE